MNTILVSTDLSASSKSAAEYAARLCREWNAKMILLNILMVPVPVSDIPYTYEGNTELQAEFEKLMAAEASRLFELFDIEIEHAVEVGIPDIDITEHAKERGAGLIVMGMKHTDELDRMLGTTVNAVIRKSKIPALVIPEGHVFNGIHAIAYATDLSYEANTESFRPVRKLAATFGASLHLIHVQKPDEIVSQHDISGKIRLAVATDGLDYHYHTVQDADIDHGIRHFLHTNSIDMLAMTAHKHTFLERLFGKRHTKTLLYSTEVPLLVLHDQV